MAFRHGVYKQEVPTSLIPPAQTEAGLPVIVGTAPIHLASDEEAMSNVNKPQLIYTYSEAVQLFGYFRDWGKYTLCEFMYSQFAQSLMKPCVLINVLDPAKHKGERFREFAIVDGTVDLGPDILITRGFSATNFPTEDEEAHVCVNGMDYWLDYDDDGYAILNVLDGGALSGQASVSVNFTRFKPELVNVYDILGGVDAAGAYLDLELVNAASLRFRD